MFGLIDQPNSNEFIETQLTTTTALFIGIGYIPNTPNDQQRTFLPLAHNIILLVGFLLFVIEIQIQYRSKLYNKILNEKRMDYQQQHQRQQQAVDEHEAKVLAKGDRATTKDINQQKGS